MHELLENTKAGLERIKTSYQNLKHRKEASTNLTENNQEWMEKMDNLREKFMKEMDDDFNTANGISVFLNFQVWQTLFNGKEYRCRM